MLKPARISTGCGSRLWQAVVAAGNRVRRSAAMRYRFRSAAPENLMPATQLDKAQAFRSLHSSGDPFVIANAWDAGSARILAGLGFAAIATSSGACAGTLGRLDGRITREEALTHIRAIAPVIDVPLAGDLENGFSDAPDAVAMTISMAADAGLVGGSIEDASGGPDHKLYGLTQALERVAAAVEAARALPLPFTLTARCENFLRGNPNLDDTIQRLQAYERAGADVLFAPGLPDLAAVRAVCQALTKPVNFMVGIKGRSFSVPELAAAGVKRISLATSLYRAAMNGLIEAAREVQTSGTFQFLDRLVPGAELNGYMSR
jgi:2-methylisocitrate lyase-like PEP mutase family enzyme